MLQVIVLAAGKGTRLLPLTRSVPKALVPLFSEERLVSNLLRFMDAQRTVRKVAVITGYKREIVEDYVASSCSNKVACVYNRHFEGRGPSYSVLLGLKKLSTENPIVIVNGDTFFSRNALQLVMESIARHREEILLFGSAADEFLPDDLKVRVDGNKVVAVGKDVSSTLASMRSAGLLYIGRPLASEMLLKAISEMYSDGGCEAKTWHQAISNCFLGAQKEVIRAQFLPARSWHEVDNHRDLKVLKSYYEKSLERMTLVTSPGVIEVEVTK